MVCSRLKELLQYEMPHYRERLKQRKVYFDEQTKCDVWMYLVERDFQKRFFDGWAVEEKKKFCRGCDVNEGCEISS